MSPIYAPRISLKYLILSQSRAIHPGTICRRSHKLRVQKQKSIKYLMKNLRDRRWTMLKVILCLSTMHIVANHHEEDINPLFNTHPGLSFGN